MSKGNMLLENTALYGLLQADGMAELKSKIINMIVEEIHDQLHQSTMYIVSPEDIANDLYEDNIRSVKKEVREEYKERIIKKLDAMI